MRLGEIRIKVRYDEKDSSMFPGSHPKGWYWWFSVEVPGDPKNHLVNVMRGPYAQLEDVQEAVLEYGCDVDVLNYAPMERA